jgi:hypothetical protein
MRAKFKQTLFVAMTATLMSLLFAADGVAQKKKRPAKPPPASASTQSELEKLRQQYIETTKEYKASLEKLRELYKASARKAEDRLDKSKDLFKDGLISKKQVEEGEQALEAERLKISGVEQQLKTADTLIAQTLVEVESEKHIAKFRLKPKNGFIQTASFIRYTGAGSWAISQADKLESYFQQSFRRPLPIAVFGQGSIHNRWRLDHRNAMDVSLHPDGAEGQALIGFMRRNGIPFSAFRGAIPGVATGPHIHIGRPSHRY